MKDATVNEAINEIVAAVNPIKMPETCLTVIPGGRPDLDEDARVMAQAAAAVNEPVRLKLSVGMYLPKSRVAKYKYWRGVSWTMEFATLADMIAFREAEDQFIQGWFAARKQQ